MDKRVRHIDTGKIPDSPDELIKYNLQGKYMDFTYWIEEIDRDIKNLDLPYHIRLIEYELCLAHYDYVLGTIFNILWQCTSDSLEAQKKIIRKFYKQNCNFTAYTTNIVLDEVIRKTKFEISKDAIMLAQEKKTTLGGKNKTIQKHGRRIAGKSFVKNIVIGKISIENEGSLGASNFLESLFPVDNKDKDKDKDKRCEYIEVERVRNRSRRRYKGPFDNVDAEFTKLIKEKPWLFIRIKPEYWKKFAEAKSKREIEKLADEDYLLEEIFPLELLYSETEQLFHLSFQKS